jgi:hypothetical protein
MALACQCHSMCLLEPGANDPMCQFHMNLK